MGSYLKHFSIVSLDEFLRDTGMYIERVKREKRSILIRGQEDRQAVLLSWKHYLELLDELYSTEELEKIEVAMKKYG